jgi:hypothetical protein
MERQRWPHWRLSFERGSSPAWAKPVVVRSNRWEAELCWQAARRRNIARLLLPDRAELSAINPRQGVRARVTV